MVDRSGRWSEELSFRANHRYDEWKYSLCAISAMANMDANELKGLGHGSPVHFV